MKALLSLLSLMVSFLVTAQITSPVIRANFGVDADLRANFFSGSASSGNDDFFLFPGSTGSGQFIIDTTGAAAHLARYATDLNFRRLPFFRTMRYPSYSVVNNRLLIDAVFIRDYHGDDSTIFASGSNKNGMSPQNWTCPVAQSIPDKNEILDMMVHVRRAGPNKTDSLWMFGGVSIENTTGNRYFDFEMYQTDIYYDRATRRFYNYGPDAGHTSWEFNDSGHVTKAGDIIFTAEYSSSSLSSLQARIWVSRFTWENTIPTAFNWTGSFDGDGSGAGWGYAGILPRTAGAFYTGLQSSNNTWAGPFGLVLGDNSVVTNYTARQFMEFSVNLTKLGLDPVTLLGGSNCGMPFRRILVKSRASTSFTAELKDFIGPFDFFMAPRAEITTDKPYICDSGSIAQLWVVDPAPTSTYQWTTLNGNIVGPTTGPTITVDTPGVYIVYQYLQSGCDAYASDTLEILPFEPCGTLSAAGLRLNVQREGTRNKLQWTILDNTGTDLYEPERSPDGRDFQPLARLAAWQVSGAQTYIFYDEAPLSSPVSYYRLRYRSRTGSWLYSRVVQVRGEPIGTALRVFPNPAQDHVQLQFALAISQAIRVVITDAAGRVVYRAAGNGIPGEQVWQLPAWPQLPAGVYQVELQAGTDIRRSRLLIR